MALPFFYSLTGCDTVSAVYDKGKKTAWGVWRSLTDLTLPLQLLSCANPTSEMIARYTQILQEFVLKLYGVKDEDFPTWKQTRIS